ncbi:MAG: hypothetical protein CMK59_11895 [Proteobacteria bacterium]|nr:hypothetical protein [Pseudomonadota bacterium]
MTDKISFSARILAQLLRPRLGHVRAVQRALRLEGVVRFAFLTLSLVVFPSLVLAYLGLSSAQQSRSQEAELEAMSRSLSRSFIDAIGSEFTDFATTIRYQLESGRSPMAMIHPDQRIALRFDQNQDLVAPFVEEGKPSNNPWSFHPAVLNSSLDSSKLRIFKTNPHWLPQGWKKATVQLNQRDLYGARQKHLKMLEQAQRSKESERSQAFKSIVERLLDESWTLQSGMEGAIANRALSQIQGDPVMLAGLRARLDERILSLYWTAMWEQEWRDIILDSRQTRAGDLVWLVREKAIWAMTRWGESTYVFGIDKLSFIERMGYLAEEKSQFDSRLGMKLIAPGSLSLENTLVQRNAPFLDGWSIVVYHWDPLALKEAIANDRRKQVGVVGLSIFCISFGLFLSFRVAAQEVEVANIKSNFAASVSHELRSPITQIRLKGESLMFGLAETEDEHQEHYEAIVRESERLTWLVDNVLDYASIEREATHYLLRPNDLNETVGRVVDSLMMTLSMKDVVLELKCLEPELFVQHDADAISQCVINLLSNAVKYGGEDKWVGMIVRRVFDGVEIAISDNGMGIAPEEIKKIFEPFYRTQSSRNRKGTGIGLSIVKHIIDSHGGRVIVQSQLDKGTTVILHFPEDLIVQREKNV